MKYPHGQDGGRWWRRKQTHERRSRKVVNPHTWPMSAKIDKIGRGDRQPTHKQRYRGGAPAHPKPTPGVGEERVRSSQARMGKIPPSSTGVRLLDPQRPCSAARSGASGTGKICVSAGSVIATLECVVERGEKLKPSLDARVVIPYVADALKQLVIRKKAKFRVPKVEVFDNQDDAVSFQVERSPVPLSIKGRVADIRSGPPCALRLLLRTRSAKNRRSKRRSSREATVTCRCDDRRAQTRRSGAWWSGFRPSRRAGRERGGGGRSDEGRIRSG